jgi:molybdate transport system substrate-binding protein
VGSSQRSRVPDASTRLAVLSLVALAALLGATGCPKRPSAQGSQASGPKAAGPASQAGAPLSGKLTVLVPCGQINPYMEIKALFVDKNPGVKIDQKSENINVLRKKLLQGKEEGADIFLDLGDTIVAELAKDSLIVPGTETPFAQNALAVIVPKANRAGIHAFADLGKPEVETIGLAEPSENASGYYAVEALKKTGLYDGLMKARKIVTVSEPALLKTMVITGKVDAAVIYAPCAHEQPKGEEKPAGEPTKATMLGSVPEDLYTPFYCTAVVLKQTTNEAAARAFVQFLASDEASEVWQKWYFGPRPSKAEAKAEALLVHCGAGIRPPMDELAALFRKRTGVRVDMAYKGSGCLLADIEFSRKGDLYMPGEPEYMDQAKKKGFIVEERPIAAMETVIITPLKPKRPVRTLADLGEPGLKVGLGADPQVAVGIAARKVLDKAGLWGAVKPNVTMNAMNVVELANACKLDALDAAIVWDATAHLVKGEVQVIPIDPKVSYRTTIPFGTLKFSRHADKAQLFLDLVSGIEGQEVFKKHGYDMLSQ